MQCDIFSMHSLLPTGGMHDMATAPSVYAHRQIRGHEQGVGAFCPKKQQIMFYIFQQTI